MAATDGIQPANIMRNVYAVYPSFAMLAAMQLDVFTPLQDGPMTAEALARALGVRAEKLSPLLHALVPAGLLTARDGAFANTEEADKYLVKGRTEYMGGLGGFYASLWRATLNTAESIRTGEPQSAHDWASLPKEQLLKYFDGQYPGSLRAGKELAAKVDFTRFGNLLDAGGGTGGVSIGICQACPALRAAVVDLPAVVTISRRFISEAGMAHRIRGVPGNLVDGPPEGRYDVAVLRAFLQVLSPGDAAKALRHVSLALEPGGRLYVVGSILDDSRLGPPASLGFGLVFLNMYKEGRSYTHSEHAGWLRAAGFEDVAVEYQATCDGLSIVSARRI